MRKAELQQIRQAIAILFDAHQVVEVRVPAKFGVASGYFDDHEKLAQAVKEISDSGKIGGGVYYTLNPCHTAMTARRKKNQIHQNAKEATSDTDILRRRWFLIDFDPIRPNGVSSTKQESSDAKHVLEATWGWLSDQGWPEPVVAKSGNGYHLLYRVDEPNDKETAALFRDCLSALNKKFTTDKVQVDPAVFNAARITKAYGTLATKGENTLERPHRYSKVLKNPEPVTGVTRVQLEVLAGTIGTRQSQTKNSPQTDVTSAAKVEEFLQWAQVTFSAAVIDRGGSTKWILDRCPFNPEHKGSAVFLAQDGKLGFKCFHASCSENHWGQFRTVLEKNNGAKFDFRDANRKTAHYVAGANDNAVRNGNRELRMDAAYITPQVVKWARERAAMSIEQLAGALKIDSQTLTAFQSIYC